jgi:hypothetical protein
MYGVLILDRVLKLTFGWVIFYAICRRGNDMAGYRESIVAGALTKETVQHVTAHTEQTI